ncbi:uncharacterized hydrophobic domain [Mycobacteroides abscessus]|uniref:Uncharacterized hydrophobic domain n=5 Tax=Mycobacteroides abscessus TaxID=36809 RepID=A0A0U0ZGK0_9MYCO|nr:DUF389 domain-containing protein [Mycobacteroides abscessus]ESV59581.1 hypothetical protein L830_1413 [Mycobacteroides abscessus MAB_082312_2258]ESV64008.1 hypothetical protein L833_1387 [Mycobacteroides abscessus MAB_091912_2446]AGM29407.1 hypothetical protein MASS_2805 [Mycobacteroides abscessus subsp. bolletii 50594]AIC71984.1 membrane protein [Mycobacteroides abscessus subsp. massiliense str. GO 06]AMU26460.1 hypothetical protein A3N96_14370 [Mycobacteroides abscessus]
MLHVRVIAPAEVSDQVVEFLSTTTGVTHIVRVPQAAISPAGDLITADVARETANDVLDGLKSIDIDKRGSITAEVLDTVISQTAYEAEDDAEGDPADAVIWDELIGRTREESTLNLTFLAFLCLACLIAAVGVVTDSPVTIVGAMVVGPEFGPLAALAVSIVRRKWSLARRSLLALLVGFPVAMGVTAVGALAAEAAGWVTLKSVRELQQVDFVFQVGPFSLVVALLAGAAGMLSLMSAKSAALVGVFISVTTVPAAGFAVVAATVGEWDIAGLSALQLAVNLFGIVLAGVLVLWVRPRGYR